MLLVLRAQEGEREMWEAAAPMVRLRTFLENAGRWDEKEEADARAAARNEMLTAIAAGEVRYHPCVLLLL